MNLAVRLESVNACLAARALRPGHFTRVDGTLSPYPRMFPKV